MASSWVKAALSCAVLAVVFAFLLRPSAVEPIGPPSQVKCKLPPSGQILQRFSQILQFRTISNMKATSNHVDEQAVPEFASLHAWLESSFPIPFSRLEVQKVNKWSLVLRWPGTDRRLKPTIFISHIDVVPVGNESAWKFGPFSGAVAEGLCPLTPANPCLPAGMQYVWGRGAQDVKVTVTQLLEAVTVLLDEGFNPRRTAYLAFGHDEEVGGVFGAHATAELLASQGEQPPEIILDEGGAFLVDGIPGITHVPVAVIGVAEKGYLSLKLSIKGVGGHSSTPPVGKPNVLTQMASLLQTFHRYPPPIRVEDPVPATFAALAGGVRIAALQWVLSRASAWPWRDLLGRVLARSKSADVAALVRTSAAITDLRTSPPGDNVLPDTAIANFNFRLLPGEHPGWPENYLRRLAFRSGLHEGQFTVRQTTFSPPSIVTNASGPQFAAVKAAVLETLSPPQGMLVAPNLLNGITDSSKWSSVFPDTPVLRFTPVPANMSAGDLGGIHGINERCSIDGYLQGICFYVQALRHLLT